MKTPRDWLWIAALGLFCLALGTAVGLLPAGLVVELLGDRLPEWQRLSIGGWIAGVCAGWFTANRYEDGTIGPPNEEK